MNGALQIIGVSAVTSAGLTAAQTCAAIRARISGLSEAMLLPPPAEAVPCAIVPAARRLKRTPEEWLVNLAVRALQECLADVTKDLAATVLLMAMPEPFREHPAITDRTGCGLLERIQRRLGQRFHPSSMCLPQGRAAPIHALGLAHGFLASGHVRYCIVGGVDSLISRPDLDRLAATARLHVPGNPQGAIPGEGAAFLVLSQAEFTRSRPSALILGAGSAQDPDNALGERYAVGRGLHEALGKAVRDAGIEESRISFRVSDMNGERYFAWNSLLGSSRFYRTRREHLTVWYPASSVGDLGAAAGALAAILAATGIARGYAPGPVAMCEAASDEGLHAACVLAPARGAPQPPFHESEI